MKIYNIVIMMIMGLSLVGASEFGYDDEYSTGFGYNTEDTSSLVTHISAVINNTYGLSGADLTNVAFYNQTNTFADNQFFGSNTTIFKHWEDNSPWDSDGRRIYGERFELSSEKSRAGELINTFFYGSNMLLKNYGSEIKPFGYSVNIEQYAPNESMDASGFVSHMENLNKSSSYLKAYNARLDDADDSASDGLVGFYTEIHVDNESTELARGLAILSQGDFPVTDGIRMAGQGDFHRGVYVETRNQGVAYWAENLDGSNYSMVLNGYRDFLVNQSGEVCIGCDTGDQPTEMLMVRGAEDGVVFSRDGAQNQNISFFTDGSNTRMTIGGGKSFILDHANSTMSIAFRLGGQNFMEINPSLDINFSNDVQVGGRIIGDGSLLTNLPEPGIITSPLPIVRSGANAQNVTFWTDSSNHRMNIYGNKAFIMDHTDGNAILFRRLGNTMLELDIAGDVKITNGLDVGDLSGSYTGGSAYVCVYDSGVIYASEVACP